MSFKYLSALSTLGKKIVANKKEKISIPIIDAKKGRMLQARVPIITRTSSL